MFSNIAQNVENLLNLNSSNEEILDYLSETNKYFGAERSVLPDFLKVYGYIRGDFLDGSGWIPPDEYDPPSRPWYIGAVESGDGIFFSEPYVDADTGGMCISFSRQLFDQNKNSYGVVAIDLNLTRITDYVAGQKIANDGYGVLIDDRMLFTSHRDSAMIGVEMSAAGEGYAHLEEMLVNELPIAAERFTDTDGTDSIAFFRTIFNGWHIGIIIPRASYYQQVNNLAAVLAVLGSALAAILAYMLVRTRVEKMRSDEENKSKSSFLARMSHEMRTPMNAIIGMSEIAQKTDDVQKMHECLDEIDNAANHLLGVINDVLDMSKIEAGKLELSETTFYLEKMIDQVVSVAGFRIKDKNQHFTVQIDEDVPRVVRADRQRLAQVITNLLSNATKFTDEGGHIELYVRHKETAGEQSVLEIEVKDDGIGISAEQQTRLFQSFEQADGSISRKYGGTGLGLAISKRIIEMMGGREWIISELGEGARFIFTVRVGIGSAEEAEENEVDVDTIEELGDTLKGKHILLAEDVEVNREILLALLEGTGILFDCAENGKQAIEMFKENPGKYDMIFMDIHMPEVDGYEATQRIRAMEVPQAKTIPIVAMTANVFKEDIEKCLAAGMNDHVGKPLEMSEVAEKLQKYLG